MYTSSSILSFKKTLLISKCVSGQPRVKAKLKTIRIVTGFETGLGVSEKSTPKGY